MVCFVVHALALVISYYLHGDENLRTYFDIIVRLVLHSQSYCLLQCSVENILYCL